MTEETDTQIPESEAVDQQQACSAFWTPATTKPGGCERKVLCWVVWPECGWPSPPEPIIGWWKHGPECFAVESVEHANHLVTHWAEIPEPNDQTQQPHRA